LPYSIELMKQKWDTAAYRSPFQECISFCTRACPQGSDGQLQIRVKQSFGITLPETKTGSQQPDRGAEMPFEILSRMRLLNSDNQRSYDRQVSVMHHAAPSLNLNRARTVTM
jgi:hypothetical protein